MTNKTKKLAALVIAGLVASASVVTHTLDGPSPSPTGSPTGDPGDGPSKEKENIEQ